MIKSSNGSLLKRILAGFLVVLFLLPFMPQIDIFANQQGNIIGLGIAPGRNVTAFGASYTIPLQWVRPDAVTEPNAPPNYIAAGGNLTSWNSHRATTYQIMRFNASDNVGGLAPTAWGTLWQPAPGIPNISSTAEFIGQDVNQTLGAGRFYAFHIRAWHYHTIQQINPITGALENVNVPSNFSQPASPAVYVMTDFAVEAEGAGQGLIVRWSRPRIGGLPAANNMDPFDAYRIEFELSAGGQRFPIIVPRAAFYDPAHPLFSQTSIITRPGNNVQFYEIHLPNLSGLVPGRAYNVWVEPMINNLTRENGLSDALYANLGIEVHHTNPVTNPFWTTNVFVPPILSVHPVGMNYILLNWAAVPGQIARLWQVATPQNIPIAEFTGQAAGHVDFLLLPRPLVTTTFLIQYFTADGIFITELEVTFDPARAEFVPTRPNIYHVTDTNLTNQAPPLGLQITWDAFVRDPFTTAEAESGRMVGPPEHRFFHDPDVVYDVWITDDASVFEAPSIGNQWLVTPPQGLAQSAINDFLIQTNVAGNYTTFRYRHLFTEFVDGDGVRQPIVENRVYYIRIVARRTGAGGQESGVIQVSEAAYAAHFVSGDVHLQPPVLQRPPLHIDQEASGFTNLQLAWRTRWVEAFEQMPHASPDYPGVWQSAFGLRAGQLVFDEAVVAPDRHTVNPDVVALHNAAVFPNEDAVRTALNAIGVMPPPLRTQYLPHPTTAYRLHVVPLDVLRATQPLFESDFEAFVTMLIQPQNTGLWSHGVVPASALTVDANGNVSLNITGLLSNTTYAIFIQPINLAGGGQAWWPTFITGTTDNERDPMDIIPPAPFLNRYAESDRWLEFVLRPHSTDGSLLYEFWISELPDRSTAWQFTPQPEFTRPFQYAGGQNSLTRQIFRATNLFPETTYYIWVRAISASSPARYSWSSGLSMQTNPIAEPLPPRGLGLASQGDVNIINLENETNHSRIASDHMIISWLPNGIQGTIPADTNLPMETTGGAGGTTIFGSASIAHAYMVLFPDLQPNRGYWVRARTIYSVHRDGVGGEITDRINYVIQVATNSDFVDAVTVYVLPDANTITAGFNTRMSMSEWSTAFQFFTTRDDGEYDGDVIAELFPLPMRDWEVIYNAQTRTLTWRFRSTGVDAQGHRDNLVDQRFISRLIQTRVFNYTIDMTTYDGRPVDNRIIEIPSSIITAFDERGITLTVIAGETSYVFDPGFTQTPQNSNFGRDSRLRMYISTLTPQPTLQQGRTYATTPQNVAVNVQNGHSRTPLTNLASPMTATHSVNRAMAMDFNVGAYVLTANDAQWRRYGGNFNDNTGTIATTTTQPSSFAAIFTAVPQQFANTPAVRDALHFVNSRIVLGNMDWFSPDVPINTWQMNNMIWAIATRAQSADLNADLTQAQLNSLANSRMLVPGHDTVTRQDAMSGLVALYEARAGRQVASHPTLENSFFPDIASAHPALQRSMLQAEALGFLGFATNNARPHAEMTLGEAMLIFEIILRN